MAVDTATHIGSLNAALPAGTEAAAELDNNLRHIKGVLVTDLAGITGPVTATHTELNFVDGVTSAIQTQLDAKAPLSSPAFTDNPTAPTAAVATATTQLATTAFVATAVATQVAVPFSATTTATSKTLAAFEHCIVTASAQTISLPAAPVAGATVCRIGTRDAITTTIARNGLNIMGLAEDMEQPYGNYTATLAYHNATDGWVLQ